MILIRLAITSLLFALTLVACSDPKPSSSAALKNEPSKQGIAWFEGSVDEAFETAKMQSKPLFLYWGAVWCPPCQEIKHTVFKSRQFIAQSKSFVPVYLDGDTGEAQSIGEKFGVKGYPTMILFNPEGVELTRIPGGIDISRYNDVLATALESITPTHELIARLATEPDTLTEENLKQLAYYSWGQDDRLPKDNLAEHLLVASNLSQDQVSSSRLYMQYLYETQKAFDDDSPSAVIDGALARVESILASPRLVLANWDSLAYAADDLTQVIADKNEIDALKVAWQNALLGAMNDKSLSTAEQLGGLLPALSFHFEKHDELSADLRNKVLAATKQADANTQNSFARQSVVNQINYILQQARLMDEAKVLLHAELERSKSPYYFMSSLASIAEKEQDIPTALAWRKKAFETSEGSATRFQWGANYIRALVRLTPEDESTIKTVSLLVFDEIESDAELFSGRNFRVLRSINKTLLEWQDKRSEQLLTELQNQIAERCAQLLASTQAMQNCQSLTEKNQPIVNTKKQKG